MTIGTSSGGDDYKQHQQRLATNSNKQNNDHSRTTAINTSPQIRATCEHTWLHEPVRNAIRLQRWASDQGKRNMGMGMRSA
eukprot:9476416-Pyramimonas_sp.AAC.1